jgi:hypothetical protein
MRVPRVVTAFVGERKFTNPVRGIRLPDTTEAIHCDDGYDRQIVEDAVLGTAAVILVHRASGVVADIISDIVAGD